MDPALHATWDQPAAIAHLCGMTAQKEVPLAPKGKRPLLRKLRSTYRLLLIDDRTFAEKFSIKLNRLNVLLLAVAAFTLHGLFVTAVIVLTPLKQYIPGYSDQATKENAYYSTLKADSLEMQLAVRDSYIDNIRMVLSGALPADSATLFTPTTMKPEAKDLVPGRADSLLRARIERDEAYNLVEGRTLGERRELSGVFFFPPLRGIVTTTFDRGEGHFGIDIVAAADAAVKSCLDGTVTLASWTTDGGHVIQVQHRNNLVSSYKHNSTLLRKVGDRVKAGEAIAIVGNSGELSTGPHLHFELWLNGVPVDPQAYMVFD
jgi:murein DD-endopeptidase MepM/ murein hydrolase activator NlpD